MGNVASSERTKFHPTKCCSYVPRPKPVPRRFYSVVRKQLVAKVKWRTEIDFVPPRRDLHDSLYFRSVIGRGGFGTVFCVTDTYDGSVRALKCLNKERATKDGVRELFERDVMYELECRLTTALIATGESQNLLRMLMEFSSGGDLKALSMRYGRLDEPTARFFAAQIVLAVDYLQRCSVLHRDLKPENVFLDMGGYCKLADFGLARRFVGNERSVTWIGTVPYMAPEVLLEIPYSLSPDCFGLGCIIYEFVFGKYPFGSEEDERRQRIDDKPKLHGRSHELQSLLTGLLRANPNARLGCRGKGFVGVLKHDWFRDVNWLSLYHRRYQCPIEIFPGQGWMFSRYEMPDNPIAKPEEIMCDF